MGKLNFIFVGPQRTGTTWIYNHLTQHPELCFPKGVKETMFFDRNYEKGIEWYQRYFSQCKTSQKCGEIAPTYFDSKEAPVRIKKQLPDCKIVITLRDPVEKARSLYQYHYQKGRVKGSFSEAIKIKPDIVTSGYYKDHIERWFSFFDEMQILVISMQEIKNNPDLLLNRLCSFLEVDRNLLNGSANPKKVNPTLIPRIHGLARIGMLIVNKLHAIRLHWIVNVAKKIGLKKLLFTSGEKPRLTMEEEQFLKEQYAPHVSYINSKFENLSL